MQNSQSHRKIRMGMIGGGQGSFIGAVHRQAAALDGEIELVCGAFSSNADRSLESGRALYLSDDRIYPSWKEMISKEANLPDDKKMDFVSIVTPNHVHFEPAKMAIETGFHVMVDKPMCFSLEQSFELEKLVNTHNRLLGLTHTYTGYPMVKEARQIVKKKTFGTIRKVFVEYPQGWLSRNIEQNGQKQAGWRTDPGKSGKAGCIGDIGTHAANLAEYICGQKITSLSAQLNAVVSDRKLDDDGTILLKFENGATGVLMASQIAAGEENNLKIRVYGEEGSLEWNHADPNSLLIKSLDDPTKIFRTGVDNEYLSEHALVNTRLPSGHPEGYIEAFANLYRNFALTIRSKISGDTIDHALFDFPGVDDGVLGMKFIEYAVASSAANGAWMTLK